MSERKLFPNIKLTPLLEPVWWRHVPMNAVRLRTIIANDRIYPRPRRRAREALEPKQP